MNGIYLCYDVKGIQGYIFKIPKLAYIIGGSALIDQFDRETIHALKTSGTEWLFSAGGKGTFRCESESAADMLEKEIVRLGHEIGLELRIGRGKSFSEAASTADRTYPFIPSQLEGHPCEVSGLYPVTPDMKIHPIVKQRDNVSIKTRFEKKLLEQIKIELTLNQIAECEFFHNVDSDDKHGKAGALALGGRNRWAVICMDGNDMGSQFRCHNDLHEGNIDLSWVKEMSKNLDDCTRDAAAEGVLEVVSKWKKDNPSLDFSKKTTLPIRPLVVGGDDIAILCHVGYAFDFVKKVSGKFNEFSKQFNENYKSKHGENLWIGTNGELTISAGIFFCPVSLPLHTAIPYAEALLSSAKTKGRKIKSNEISAAPACLDWEQVTDGIVDSPAAKRQREFRLKDLDKKVILELTQKPYSLSEFNEVCKISDKYKKIPATIRNQILPGISENSNNRLAFLAKLKKNHPKLVEDLNEYPIFSGKWRKDSVFDNFQVFSTPAIDALLILEENKRMSYSTTE